MSFFDDIGKAIENAGNLTRQKTRDLTGVAKINSLIAEEEKILFEVYQCIGKFYVSKHSEDAEEEFQVMVEAAKAAKEKISLYKKQIQKIRNIALCTQCGHEVPASATFCLSCGAKMQKNIIVSTEPICRNCGKLLREGMKFCTYCGTPVEENAEPEEEITSTMETIDRKEEHVTKTIEESKSTPICMNCGKPLKEDMQFCTNCGVMVKVKAESAEKANSETEEVKLGEEEIIKIAEGNRPTPTLICAKCGDVLQEDAQFCINCGAPVMKQQMETEITPQLCSKCGAVLSKDAMFCEECGTRISPL